NPELNKLIVNQIATPIIDVLHKSYATGIFVVLDGPSAPNSSDTERAGIYLRDLDTSSYASDNSDILMERGRASIAREHKIALDSQWKLGFSLDEQERASRYFFAPYHLALANHVTQDTAGDYGYLSYPFSLAPLDVQVMTYSIPLVLKDGSVIGVIGVDMTENQVKSLINFKGVHNRAENLCAIGIWNPEEATIETAISEGALFSRNFPDGILTCEKVKDYDVYQTQAADGSKWYTSVQELDVYDNNTPFAQERWAVVGMVQYSEFFYFYSEIRDMMGVALLVPLIFSLISVFFLGSMIINPIGKLVEEVGSYRGNGKVSLSRTKIFEIDRLAESIESLGEETAKAASRISDILDNVNILMGVFEYKKDADQVFCSHSLYELLGWPSIQAEYDYVDRNIFDDWLLDLVKHRYKDEENIYFYETPEQHWLKVSINTQENGNIMGIVSDATKELTERIQLERERDYDLLTGLYNRRAFREQVQKLIEENAPAAMVMWDLDNLKYINDTYGHDEGDHYIIAFANSLKKLLKEGDVAARHSGDEFVAYLPYTQSKEEIRSRMKDYIEILKAQKIDIKSDVSIPLRASAGIAWFPEDSNHYDSLFQYADFAMYTVKHSVKGIALEFDKQLYTQDVYMLTGQEEFSRMLEKWEATFAYQPIMDRTGAVYGYEMLMRPQLQHIKNIEEILRLAKAQSKLQQLEELTWKTATKAANQQKEAGNLIGSQKVFINSISNTQISEAMIEELQAQYGGLLENVVIELTENEPISDDCLEKRMTLSKQWKCMIAIDDFGSGYNSESVLLRINPHIVKLDMKLVQNIDQDKNRQVMLENLLTYTKNRRIITLAEGVETFEELKMLMNYGIDLFQGFYIARPELEIRPISSYVLDKVASLNSGM
ncbi:MAG: EAL domain-containing protein, partial [Hungatella sp.]